MLRRHEPATLGDVIAHHVGLVLLHGAQDELRLCPGRADTLVQHASVGLRHRPRQGHHAVLGHRVGRHFLVDSRSKASHGGRVDDLARLAGLPHPLLGYFRAQHDGDDVDLHALPPAEVGVDPSIISQEVNTRDFEELLSFVKQVVELFLTADIARHEADIVSPEPVPEFPQSGLACLLVYVRYTDLGSGLQQPPNKVILPASFISPCLPSGEGLSKTLSTSSDDADFVPDVHSELRQPVK